MADFKLNETLIIDNSPWTVISVDDESMELMANEANHKGYRRVIKIMLSDAHNWNIWQIFPFDIRPIELTKEQMEDLLA